MLVCWMLTARRRPPGHFSATPLALCSTKRTPRNVYSSYLHGYPQVMTAGLNADDSATQADRAPLALDVKNLVVSFDSRPLFSSISFELAANEILFVKGPSGIGKSRLLRALSHLDRSWTGEVKLSGSTAAQVGFPNWRRRVCYVSDSPPPLTTSAEAAFESLLEFSTRRGRADNHGSLTALRDIASTLGISQEILARPFTVLSAGERQRVALSWAIALRPEVRLLPKFPLPWHCKRQCIPIATQTEPRCEIRSNVPIIVQYTAYVEAAKSTGQGRTCCRYCFWTSPRHTWTQTQL